MKNIFMKKAKKTEKVLEEIEQEVVEKTICTECNGRGLKDANTLCLNCEGSGQN